MRKKKKSLFRYIKNRKYFADSGKSVSRHVAEMMLGRKLKPWEVVHHKDGNPLNNSRDNLEVMSRSKHSRMHAQIR